MLPPRCRGRRKAAITEAFVRPSVELAYRIFSSAAQFHTIGAQPVVKLGNDAGRRDVGAGRSGGHHEVTHLMASGNADMF